MREWLKQQRRNSGLTQLEVSRKLNISEGYYSMIEKGERMPKMTIDIAKKLSQILGVSLEMVLENESTGFQQKKEREKNSNAICKMVN